MNYCTLRYDKSIEKFTKMREIQPNQTGFLSMGIYLTLILQDYKSGLIFIPWGEIGACIRMSAFVRVTIEWKVMHVMRCLQEISGSDATECDYRNLKGTIGNGIMLVIQVNNFDDFRLDLISYSLYLRFYFWVKT